MDNVFIERRWKSVKCEDIHLKAYGSMAEVKKGLATYFQFYNEKRWHQDFDRKTRLWFTSALNRRDRLRHEHEPRATSHL